LNGAMNYPDSDSSEIELEFRGVESSAAESDILSSSNKKNIYARVYGGQYKEGSNAEIEICLLDKADYYTEESVLSHAIKNVTVKVGEKTYRLNIPAGAYEEDGIYFELGNDLKSGNYSVIIEIPENKYYNAQTFTFKNTVHIISESNKAVTSIDKYDIIPSDTFSGIDGDVYLYVQGGVDDLNLTGNVTVTLTNSNATKEVKKSKARKAKIKITLKTNYKKALTKKTVYIKINKKTYVAKTNKKGVAAFKVKLPKVKDLQVQGHFQRGQEQLQENL